MSGKTDLALNRFLGIPDSYKLGKSQAFKMYSLFSTVMNGTCCQMGVLNILYYVDFAGDFMKSNKLEDAIVNEIFKNMSKQDQFTILQYIEYMENDDERE